jgi:protein ImuB
MFACLYRPPAPGERGRARPAADAAAPSRAPGGDHGVGALVRIAQEFSPRYERHDDRVTIDVEGLTRLLGTPGDIAAELRREAAARGVLVHVAVAGTCMAAALLAQVRPGLTIVAPGHEAAALAPVRLDALARAMAVFGVDGRRGTPRAGGDVLSVLRAWGIRTLGELAALPAADLAARLGPQGLACRAMARGEDVRPLVTDVPDERFEASLDLEWPIEGLEPLAFVLTRLLEPLAIRLERFDRGAAVLHVALRVVGPSGVRDLHERRQELPSPLRDVRSLRTLALLDLESHPPTGAVDRVSIVIEPTPGRVLQHTLFARAHPTPEQLSTLLARLGALMGQDRIGAPATVDSHRPGAFAMTPFRTEMTGGETAARAARAAEGGPPGPGPWPLTSALRRHRQPVPARVVVEGGRPVRLSTDRRGAGGGDIVACAGPWRVSGEWWVSTRYGRDEWDVAVADGAVYRMFRDLETGGWFIDALVD